MRVPVIAGNWKMYKTAAESAAFAKAFLPLVAGVSGVEIVLAPPFPSIAPLAAALKGSGVGVASQNVHFAAEGAYTGEVSPAMVKDAGATYCIIGHSERRQYFAEDDGSVNRKTRAALAAGLTPIACVGETLEERDQHLTDTIITVQVKGVPQMRKTLAQIAHAIGGVPGFALPIDFPSSMSFARSAR